MLLIKIWVKSLLYGSVIWFMVLVTTAIFTSFVFPLEAKIEIVMKTFLDNFRLLWCIIAIVIALKIKKQEIETTAFRFILIMSPFFFGWGIKIITGDIHEIFILGTLISTILLTFQYIITEKKI